MAFNHILGILVAEWAAAICERASDQIALLREYIS